MVRHIRPTRNLDQALLNGSQEKIIQKCTKRQQELDGVSASIAVRL